MMGDNKRGIHSSKGIALLQVLLISAIITVLALYLTLTAQQQISVAQLAADKATAELHLRSTESEVLFNLLTREESTDNQELALPDGYNFYNTPFKVGKYAKVSLQDVSGLIDIHYPDETLLSNTIKNLGFDGNQAAIVVDSLLDWQDSDSLSRLNGAERGDYELGPRNRLISSYSELKLVKGFTSELWDKLTPLLSSVRTKYFNPMVSPEPILKAYLNRDVSDILELRAANKLTRSEFSQLTGEYEKEGLIFSNSKFYLLNITIEYNDVRIEKQRRIKFDPYASSTKPVVDDIDSIW
ncbi:general secretion pathway protein GspK [Vibrio sp. 03-59-1]|uniref:general secretion pathway protein GspK n=1 Tax=Vibrio sp. 03-59-1 TaxID=2607607 RepID=UPI001493444D|nr:type II secretion system protein GspK [Vibrio sp. 03-59-1]NOH84551.1 general secretion pathway protein GspK [Vibrio sp. 03-59-1]